VRLFVGFTGLAVLGPMATSAGKIDLVVIRDDRKKPSPATYRELVDARQLMQIVWV
jgi:hypothetical protein